MRTMNQPLACSFRCARRTLPWFIELIRASLEYTGDVNLRNQSDPLSDVFGTASLRSQIARPEHPASQSRQFGHGSVAINPQLVVHQFIFTDKTCSMPIGAIA